MAQNKIGTGKRLSAGRILWCYFLQYLRDHLYIKHAGDIIIINDTLKSAKEYHTFNGMTELTETIKKHNKMPITKQTVEDKKVKAPLYYILNSLSKHLSLFPFNDSFYSGHTGKTGYINFYIMLNKIQWLDCKGPDSPGALLFNKFIDKTKSHMGQLKKNKNKRTKKNKNKRTKKE